MVSRAFGIYLNSNARRVSPDVVGRIEELVHPDDIFYVSSIEESHRCAAAILERGYPTVFTGGGDGTFVQLVNALHQEAGPERAIPVLGVLSLGTGNALSRMVSSGSAIQDLKAYVANPSSDIWTISLIESEGQLYPFGSLGLDAEILSDYQEMKERVGQGRLKPLFQNVGGYFAAYFGSTVPRHLRDWVLRRKVRVRVTNLGDDAYLVGPEGSKETAFKAGDVLFEGEAISTAAGAIPMYGYGLRLFPWADRHLDFFQLRVVDVPMTSALVNLPSIWNGKWTSDGLFDFYVRRVRLEYSEPMPFQLAGDLVGHRRTVEMEIRPRAVELVRFI